MPDELLGRCPRCERVLPVAALVLAYVNGDNRALLAACPACRAVVHPTQIPIPPFDE